MFSKYSNPSNVHTARQNVWCFSFCLFSFTLRSSFHTHTHLVRALLFRLSQFIWNNHLSCTCTPFLMHLSLNRSLGCPVLHWSVFTIGVYINAFTVSLSRDMTQPV
jgi:hypothetical protein